jgi:hypothetical protein
MSCFCFATYNLWDVISMSCFCFPTYNLWDVRWRKNFDAFVGSFLKNGIDFNVYRSPYWKEKERNLVPTPKVYKPPIYEMMRILMSFQGRAQIDATFHDIKISWKYFRLSIVSNDWSTIISLSIFWFLSWKVLCS